jgi:NhaP-type Na+/H+ or K+/H+ antiporter
MEWALAIVAFALLGFAAVSRRLEGTPITATIVFVGIGLLVGPKALDAVQGSASSAPVRLVAEAALTFVLFADASRINIHTLRRELGFPSRLLGIGLPLTIASGAIAAAVLFGQLSIPEALVVAVLLAPTDAALGQSVVTEPRLPSRIRQGLNVESGLNDGICVPLLFIVLAIAEADAGLKGDSAAIRLVLEELGYGILGGIVAGLLVAAVIRIAGHRGMIDSGWLQVVPFAGAALSYGLAAPLGGSGFIAAFVAGAVFGALQPSERGEATYLVDQCGEVLNAVAFLAFGAVLLGPALGDLTWSVAAYAVLSLTIVRMLPVAIAMIGTHARPPTVAFVGWFGPRGLASIVFAVIVVEEAHLPHTSLILLVTFATVGLSALAHGLSAAPLTGRYVRWYESHPAADRPAMEGAPAPSTRWRRPQAVPVAAGAPANGARRSQGSGRV